MVAKKSCGEKIDQTFTPSGSLNDEKPHPPLNQCRDGLELPVAEISVGISESLPKPLKRLCPHSFVVRHAISRKNIKLDRLRFAARPTIISTYNCFKDSEMPRTVFMGNLPTWVTADEIENWLTNEDILFDEVKVIRDFETQESKGYAFVEAASDEDLKALITRFNRAPLEDKVLRVNEARANEGQKDRVRRRR